jgi:hypothetical protein
LIGGIAKSGSTVAVLPGLSSSENTDPKVTKGDGFHDGLFCCDAVRIIPNRKQTDLLGTHAKRMLLNETRSMLLNETTKMEMDG